MCAYQIHSRGGQTVEVGWEAATGSYFARAYPTPGAEPTDLLPDRTDDRKITDPADLCDALEGQVDIPLEVVEELLHDRAVMLMHTLNADVEEDPPESDPPCYGVVQRGHSPGFLDGV